LHSRKIELTLYQNIKILTLNHLSLRRLPLTGRKQTLIAAIHHHGATAVVVLCSLWAFTSPAKGLAQGIEYQAGQLDISLSENVANAINNGIPLTFICEYTPLDQRFFITWRRPPIKYHFVVTHHALTNSYLVSYLPGTAPKIFRSITESMGFVAQRAEAMFNRYNLTEEKYQMRVRLSKTELPSPIRFNAFVSQDWDLNTGWKSWQSAQ